MGLVKTLEEDRLTEKADSLEAGILEVIIDLGDEVDRGILPVKRITEVFNDDRSEKLQVTPQKIGRRLSAMGFKKAKTSSGTSAILWDEKHIERMMGAYGLRQTSETGRQLLTPL